MKQHRLVLTLMIFSLTSGLLATPAVTAQAMRVRAPRTFLRSRLKHRKVSHRRTVTRSHARPRAHRR